MRSFKEYATKRGLDNSIERAAALMVELRLEPLDYIRSKLDARRIDEGWWGRFTNWLGGRSNDPYQNAVDALAALADAHKDSPDVVQFVQKMVGDLEQEKEKLATDDSAQPSQPAKKNPEAAAPAAPAAAPAKPEPVVAPSVGHHQTMQAIGGISDTELGPEDREWIAQKANELKTGDEKRDWETAAGMWRDQHREKLASQRYNALSLAWTRYPGKSVTESRSLWKYCRG